MAPEARERSFDQLATGLASGDISRREALKWMGAALLGGAALAFTPKRAEAARGTFCFDTQNLQPEFCSSSRKTCEEALRTYDDPTDPAVSDRCYHLKG
jgi:hypothetical protein